MTALALLADGFEDLSLFVPVLRLREEGAEVRLASPLLTAAAGEHGYRVEPDLRLHEVVPSEYDLLVIPDGRAVERLRVRGEAVDVVRTFVGDGRPVAARFEFFTNPRTERRGFLMLIPAANLAAGEHTITLQPARRDPAPADTAPVRIPFWR